MAKYHYLVCKKSWLGTKKPITICTSAEAAQNYCAHNKGCVIMRQSGEGLLKKYIPEIASTK